MFGIYSKNTEVCGDAITFKGFKFGIHHCNIRNQEVALDVLGSPIDLLWRPSLHYGIPLTLFFSPHVSSSNKCHCPLSTQNKPITVLSYTTSGPIQARTWCYFRQATYSKSGLLELLKQGDSVMFDHIQDQLTPLGVRLNIHPFSKAKCNLVKRNLLKNRLLKHGELLP